MTILFIINTPAQLYFYKNIILKLENKYPITILLRDYGETIQIANEFKFKFNIYSNMNKNKFHLLLKIPKDIISILKLIKNQNIRIVIGGGLLGALIAKFIRKKSILFTDTEPEINILYALELSIIAKLSKVIFTPQSFKDLGRNHIRVNSFKEVVYLNPKYFSPDHRIFEYLGIDTKTPFAILRFNAFDAIHDIGFKNIAPDEKKWIVDFLSQNIKIYISSETQLSDELKINELKIPRHMIHSALYYSQFCITETGTMTTEAALLGTPVILIHPRANKIGNHLIFANKYKLVKIFSDFNDSKKSIEQIANNFLVEKIEAQSKSKEILTTFDDFVDIYTNKINEILDN